MTTIFRCRMRMLSGRQGLPYPLDRQSPRVAASIPAAAAPMPVARSAVHLATTAFGLLPHANSSPSHALVLVGCRRAKQKRERLRSAHLAPDYIPLGGAAGLTASSNAEAAARLRGDGAGGGDAGGDAHSDDEDPEAEDALRMQFLGADRPDKARARARAGMQVHPLLPMPRVRASKDIDLTWPFQHTSCVPACRFMLCIELILP